MARTRATPVEAAAPGRVKDIAFGAARALRTWEISELAPAARLATLTCLASLACDAGAFGAVAKERRGEGADARPVGMDIGGFKYWRLGGPSGHGVVFVEAPGLEPGEPNEPVPAPAKRDASFEPTGLDPRETNPPRTFPNRTRRRTRNRNGPPPIGARDRSSTRMRRRRSRRRRTGTLGPTRESRSGPSEKWSWYPSSAVPALVEWRASRHPDESALADALVEPTPAFDETPGDECDSRDDRDPSALDAAAAGDESIGFEAAARRRTGTRVWIARFPAACLPTARARSSRFASPRFRRCTRFRFGKVSAAATRARARARRWRGWPLAAPRAPPSISTPRDASSRTSNRSSSTPGTSSVGVRGDTRGAPRSTPRVPSRNSRSRWATWRTRVPKIKNAKP